MIVLFTILVFVVGTVVLWRGASVLEEKKTGESEKLKRPSALSQDRALYYLHLYCEAFKTQNLPALVSIMTNRFYCKVANQINAYGRLGVRKEIELCPYPPEDSAADETLLFAQGYRDMSINSTDFKVLERFVDTQTGRVIYERYKDKLWIITTLMRGAHRSEAEELHCVGCGNKVDTSGETFICKYCGATYRADSFDWVMDDVQIGYGSMLKANKRTRFLFALVVVGIAALPLSLLALFVDFFIVLTILCNLAYLAAVLIALAMEKKVVQSMSPLEQYDPGEAITRLNGRFANIVERVAFALDFDVAEAASDLETPLYEYFAALAPRGDYHVLEAAVYTGEFRYYHANNRQYIDAPLTLSFLLLTHDRQVAEIYKTVNARFYRNLGTKVSLQNKMQNVTCTGCGFPLDLTAQGACKYCGAHYDMADFDWKLAAIDPAAFDYTGAAIVPVPLQLHPPLVLSRQAQAAFATEPPQQTVPQAAAQATAAFAGSVQGGQTQDGHAGAPQEDAQAPAYAKEPPPQQTAGQTGGPAPDVPLPIPLPKDDTPEQLYSVLKCSLGKEKGSSALLFGDEKLVEKGYTSVYCVCMITNKRFTLLPFPKELSYSEDEYRPQAGMALDLKAALASFHVSSIHSYALEKIVSDTTVHLYLYNEVVLKLETPTKNIESFKQLLEYFAPGLLQAPRTMMGEYYPSISPNDPRNPYGYGYNPKHPRAYKVAYTKKLRKDPSALDEVVEFYRQDGTLPADFNIYVHGIGEFNPIPGVPMFVE